MAKFKLTHHSEDNDEGEKLHVVTAYDKEGNYAGHAVFRHTGPKHMKGTDLNVEKEHRRQGLATAMYNAAEKRHKRTAVPNDVQTGDGAAFWTARNKRLKKSSELRTQFEELKKGKSGDWKSEGYTMHTVEPEDMGHNPEDPDLADTIHAKSKDGHIVGRLNIGITGKTGYARNVEVHHQHRRKGLATAMYEHAEKHFGIKFEPGNQLDDGKALWDQKGRPFGKSSELRTRYEELKKMGAARRLYGKFDPTKALPQDGAKLMSAWVNGNTDHGELGPRGNLPEASPSAKLRMTNKLANRTDIRLNPNTKQREFLLHRQMSLSENQKYQSGNRINHDTHTSWTPHLGTITESGGIYGRDTFDPDDHDSYSRVVSAWIPESHIHTAPIQFGEHGTNEPGERGPSSDNAAREQEIIVKPGHNAEIHEIRQDAGSDKKEWTWEKINKSEQLRERLNKARIDEGKSLDEKVRARQKRNNRGPTAVVTDSGQKIDLSAPGKKTRKELIAFDNRNTKLEYTRHTKKPVAERRKGEKLVGSPKPGEAGVHRNKKDFVYSRAKEEHENYMKRLKALRPKLSEPKEKKAKKVKKTQSLGHVAGSAQNVGASALIKAKEEQKLSPESKKQFRAERKKFSHDQYQAEMTREKGVSDLGIEIRRADEKKTGVVSHGYARVMSPKDHATRAKSYLKQRAEKLKAQPKANLPDVKKAMVEADALDAVESLLKMSQPNFKFPNLGVEAETHNVALVGTVRQKKIMTRAVVNEAIPDTVIPTADGGRNVLDRQKRREAQAKTLLGQKKNTIAGMFIPTSHMPTQARRGGKQGFAQAYVGDQYPSVRMDADSEKLMSERRKQVEENARFGKPPKGKRKKKMAQLTPDDIARQQKEQLEQGKLIDSTVHHEAMHAALDKVAQKYGARFRSAVISHLLTHGLDNETRTHIFSMVQKKGYNPRNPSFHEELLTHTRDYLTNPKTRKYFQAPLGDKAREFDTKMKAGYRRMIQLAKEITPEFLLNKSEDELEKGLKELALGAAIAVAPSTQAAHSLVHEPFDIKPAIQQVSIKEEKPTLQRDLHHIAFIESSGGKNKNHAMTTVGLNTGHTAAGSTGLMPIMVKETINKHKNLKDKYGHLLDMPPDEITNTLNEQPHIEADIANHHWDRLKSLFPEAPAKRAFAWRNGITAAKRATDAEVQAHPYVQKFLSLSRPLDTKASESARSGPHIEHIPDGTPDELPGFHPETNQPIAFHSEDEDPR